MPRNRSRMGLNPLITSVGIEIEFANIPMRAVKDNRKIRNVWKIVRDGTCSRSKIMLPNGEEIVFSQGLHEEDVQLFGLKFDHVGGEFVSPIFNTEREKWYDPVLYILDILRELGEGIDLRTGIHVHINTQTPPVYVVQNLIKIGLNLEAPMFRLSCGELGFHRGSRYKDYMFCRPISSPGPQVIQDSERKWRPVFDVKKLLKVKNLDDFFTAYGRLDINGRNKWHQSRYTWLNFASILLHGSIEWRIFNSTLELDNLLAWVGLCSNLVAYSFGKDIELQEFPLGNSKLDENSEYSFDDFLIDACITDDELSKKLEHLWSLGGWQEQVKGHQKGHLKHMLETEGLSKKFVQQYLAEPVDIEEVAEVPRNEPVENSRTVSSQPITPTMERVIEAIRGESSESPIEEAERNIENMRAELRGGREPGGVEEAEENIEETRVQFHVSSPPPLFRMMPRDEVLEGEF